MGSSRICSLEITKKAESNMPPPQVAVDSHTASQMQSIGGEFAIRGEELLNWNPVLVDNMAKKGKSFKSGWVEYVVCLHQNMLYYYRDMREIPSGCMCLDGCVVEAVDRIFKNMSPGDSHILAEECGPCFKITSRMGRSLLFRTRSKETRVQWIHMLQELSYETLSNRLQYAQKERRELVDQVNESLATVEALREELASLQRKYDLLLEDQQEPSLPVVPAAPISSPPALPSPPPEEILSERLPSKSMVDPNTTIDTAALTKMTSELAGIARNLQQTLFSQPVKESTEVVPESASSSRLMMSAMEKIIYDMELEDELQKNRMTTTSATASNPRATNSSTTLYQSFLTAPAAKSSTPIVLLAQSPSAFRQKEEGDIGWSTPKPNAKVPEYMVEEHDDASMVLPRNSMISDSDMKRGDTLTSLLVRSDMIVVTALLNTCQRSDKMALLFPLLRIYGSRHALYKLMQWSIDTEVQSALSLATLFRSDDYSSRLLSTYAKAVGLRFIHTALADHIRALCTDKKSTDFELNVAKDPSLSDPAKLERNAANLMAVCQSIVDSILEHMDELPLSFVHVCRYLKERLIERFLDKSEADAYDASSTPIKAIMGGFLFLRFICPAITTPHSYGLLDEIPNASSRRILVLVTKLLFNCSTDVEFGVKEAYMRILNGFIVENAPRMSFLYSRLTAQRDGDIEACFTADSDGIFTQLGHDQLVQDRDEIMGALRKHVDEVVAKVAESSESLASQLQQVMGPGDVPLPPPAEAAGASSNSPQKDLDKTKKANVGFMGFFQRKPVIN
ncbi:unnamed protein product [Aphanomyces euteiches]